MSHCEHCQFFEIVMVQGPTPGDRLIGHCHRLPLERRAGHHPRGHSALSTRRPVSLRRYASRRPA